MPVGRAADGIAVEVTEIVGIGEVPVAHVHGGARGIGSRGNHSVVDAVVDVLLVILGCEEKEKLVAVVVEIRVWNDERATDLEARIEVLCFRPRNI